MSQINVLLNKNMLDCKWNCKKFLFFLPRCMLVSVTNVYDKMSNSISILTASTVGRGCQRRHREKQIPTFQPTCEMFNSGFQIEFI